jgi:hypothetical protein
VAERTSAPPNWWASPPATHWQVAAAGSGVGRCQQQPRTPSASQAAAHAAGEVSLFAVGSGTYSVFGEHAAPASKVPHVTAPGGVEDGAVDELALEVAFALRIPGGVRGAGGGGVGAARERNTEFLATPVGSGVALASTQSATNVRGALERMLC